MIFNGRKIEFPAITKISFAKVFESLETAAKDKDQAVANYAKHLLSLKEKYPILEEGIEDLDLVDKYKGPIHQISRVLFPDALLTNEIKALVPPYNFHPIRSSKRFSKIIEDAGGNFIYELKDYNEKMLYIMGCVNILMGYYHYNVYSGSPSQIEIFDPQLGLNRTYRLTFNADLMEVFPTERSIEITQKDYLELMENFDNLDLWKEKFPPDSWIMRGVGIVNLMDVTIDSSISGITSNLLFKTEDSFKEIENHVKRIFNIKDLRTGFFLYENDSLSSGHKGASEGIILKKDEILKTTDVLCDDSYKQLIKGKKPLILPDLDSISDNTESPLVKKLKSLKIKSYIICPLVHDDEILGFVELGSGQRNILNKVSLEKMNNVLPIISMAASRFKNEMQNRIEAIIQQECTTIHSSVKWRFEEEATDYMNKQFHNENPSFKDIVFKEVYPLYGQLDIKDSSTKRNEAMKSDLLKQIDEVRKILLAAFHKNALPVYEELIFRVDSFKAEIKKGLLASGEQKILSFLGSEIYPVFEHIKHQDNTLAKKVEKYSQMLDPDLNTVYKMRKRFDDSVTKINQTLATYLDLKQEEAQKMFPHYFERYKTDGIEYNMYIGQSIAKNREFDLLFLKNLQIWQLMIMCEMEREFNKTKKELDTKLEIASLILVYGTPLSVQFRIDEKKFDVEGAYNARYEIVKKRIDKANIKGTDERVTVPGKIAIIYSKDQDGIEYRKYITYLQAKGFLKSKIEEVELQSLQGITGLKALRVEVEYNESNKSSTGYNLDEIMEVIEKSG